MPDEHQHIMWEQRQAELWDRIFQVTQDVVSLSDGVSRDAGGDIMRDEMVRSAMAVGAHLVRANAAETAPEFEQSLKEARLKAVETDYWLRLAYVLQQNSEVQRDLSNVLTQYAGIIDLLQKFSRHARTEKNVIARHVKGPRIT